jgi:hypothetical protein
MHRLTASHRLAVGERLLTRGQVAELELTDHQVRTLRASGHTVEPLEVVPSEHTRAELRELCRQAGLAVGGTKVELAARLAGEEE